VRTQSTFSFSLFAIAALAAACSSSTGSPVQGNASDSGSSSGGGSSSGTSNSSGGSSGGSGSGSGSSSGASSGTGSSSGGSSSGGSSSGSSSGGSSSSSSSGGDAAAAGPYPSGPYCAPATSSGHLATGCVIQNMTWIGYRNDLADAISTTKPYASYSLDDARKSGKRYAMVNVAEFYCPGCAQSAMDFQASGKAVVDAGGVLIEVLETTGFTAKASMSDLNAWVNKYSLVITTVKDPDTATGTPSLDYFGRRDQAYIIDLTTMKILQYINGNIGPTSGMNSGPLGMTAMHTLLGK
jgi:hypothetical protein